MPEDLLRGQVFSLPDSSHGVTDVTRLGMSTTDVEPESRLTFRREPSRVNLRSDVQGLSSVAYVHSYRAASRSLRLAAQDSPTRLGVTPPSRQWLDLEACCPALGC
jgi:hypothetical protein